MGTFAWCEQTGGRLQQREKAQLIGMLVRSQIRDLFERRHILNQEMQRVLARVSLDQVVFPDSSLAKQAEEYAHEVYGGPLRLHCYRTYVWGALLGQGANLTFDAELLFVASVLHDLGLAPGKLDQASTCCFAMTGARDAQVFVEEHGWSSERALRVYEAITLHLNPIVDARVHGVEAQLLGDGATMDVTGARHHRIPSQVIQAVHDRYPRQGFREDILHTISTPHAPGSRPHYLWRGFSLAAKRNPLDAARFAPTEPAKNEITE